MVKIGGSRKTDNVYNEHIEHLLWVLVHSSKQRTFHTSVDELNASQTLKAGWLPHQGTETSVVSEDTFKPNFKTLTFTTSKTSF